MSGAQRIGKYEVQAVLAKGPRSAVYRGLDGNTGKSVALKVIPAAQLNAAALPAYRKYGQALQRLEHPAIAGFVDLIEDDKAVVVVSEFCEGVSLASLLKDDAHPDMKNAWEIARRLLETLAFAHLRGAVHRDVKPTNILLAPGGGLKITDFGVAALLTGAPEVVYYRAPEQFAEGGTINARTDIYNAGAIIYHLVTGKVPFSGTAAEVEHRVHQERPSDPSSYNNKIAWQLDWVIQKALSKDGAERFNAATDFAEGLRLGMQDTLGRPLDPITPPTTPGSGAPQPAAPKPAPTPIREPIKPPVAAGSPGPTAAGAPMSTGAQSRPSLAQKAQALKGAAPAPAPTPAKDATPKTRILFVDDDERIINAVRALFRQDYDVTAVVGGEAALAAIKENPPHVIVSDQRMPGITGVELLRQARELAPNAVRILLTGYTDLAALVGSINQGEIFKFVMKPWDNAELKKTVAEAVRIALELEATATKPEKPDEPAPPPVNPRSAGSLLVIDPKEGLAKGLERLLAGAAEVIQVPTPQEAIRVIQGTEIAAIVADLGAGTDGLVSLFKQLKEKRPEVLSILLAEEPDAELGIELINKAQIYRFLPKPVSAKELRTQVAAALRRYATFKQIPAMKRPPQGQEEPSAVAERARATPVRPLDRGT